MPQYVELVNELLQPSGTVIVEGDQHAPLGHAKPTESTIRAFTRKNCKTMFDFAAFDKWWVSDQYRNPQWDLLSTCRIAGVPGLLMVEAKAHATEVDEAGKSLADDSSSQSKTNHDQIGRCIDEINEELTKQIGKSAISRDTHYQLSNRVASAWKLAKCGLPVTLLYLGFTGDTYFDDHLVDRDHWQQVMDRYVRDVLPPNFTDRAHEVRGGATMRILVRSLPISSVST